MTFISQGHLSDISGRKPVLVLTLILSAVGYAMFGLATSVLFLFLARIPGGMCVDIEEGIRGESKRLHKFAGR